MPSELAVSEDKIKAQGGAMVAAANILVISSNADRGAASEMVKDVKSYTKAVEDFCNPNIQRLHAAHKLAVADRDRLLLPAKHAEQTLKQKCMAWDSEQQAKLDAERRRLEDIARKEAEAAREAERKALYAAGKRAEAAAVKAAPIVVAPVLLPEPVKQAGEIMRKGWKFKIVDADAIPREYLEIDEAAIGKVVRALGPKCKIAGVEVYEETVMGVRA